MRDQGRWEGRGGYVSRFKVENISPTSNPLQYTIQCGRLRMYIHIIATGNQGRAINGMPSNRLSTFSLA